MQCFGSMEKFLQEDCACDLLRDERDTEMESTWQKAGHCDRQWKHRPVTWEWKCCGKGISKTLDLVSLLHVGG